MKKRLWNKSGTRQLIDSGWKEFDRQTNIITSGNAMCNTQYSTCVRAWNDCECNGKTFSKGEVAKFDMGAFGRLNIPQWVKNIAFDKERTEKIWVYMFFTTNENGIEPFGWVVTSYNHKLIDKSVTCRYGKCFMKRVLALNECIAYITEE